MSDKCSVCGKFVQMDETLKIEYVPDTAFGGEKHIFTCMACANKNKCPRCGDYETRIDGYCSIYCRDMAEIEAELKVANQLADIRTLENIKGACVLGHTEEALRDARAHLQQAQELLEKTTVYVVSEHLRGNPNAGYLVKEVATFLHRLYEEEDE